MQTLSIFNTDSTDYKIGCRYVVHRIDDESDTLEASCENNSTWIFKKKDCGTYYAKNEYAGTFASGELKVLGSKKVDKMSNKNEFKVGDLVFARRYNPRRITISKVKSTGCDDYPIIVNDVLMTANGRCSSVNVAELAEIYALTPENRAALVTLHGEDAVPKLPPTPSEIMTELVKDDLHIAKVSDISLDEARSNESARLIVGRYKGEWIDAEGEPWTCVIPVDSRGNEITQLPEGV